jgi:hypothetical protein
MWQCALTAGMVGMVALVTATGWLGQVRTEARAAGQVAQYCAPEQDSDAPESPRLYCRYEHG